MFKCQVSGKFSSRGHVLPDGDHVPGEKLHKIVVARRDKTYKRWIKNEETRQWEEVEVGQGWEIVREINATEAGVALWNSWTPEQREAHIKRLGL